jgi:hypothetical protein
MATSSRQRKIAYALTSFLVGVWAFIEVNSISGPAFEPILASCTNSEIAPEDFASATGYHEYDTRVGLGAFNVLVCLITQFLLELRETHPAGLLVWMGVVVVSLPISGFSIESSGRKGAKGPILYPVTLGLLYQCFGISVMFPMVWVPAFVFGEGQRGAPLTSFRIVVATVISLPIILLTAFVFLAPTDSQLWTSSAGMLGGPVLAMSSLVLMKDVSPELVATNETAKATSTAVKNMYKLFCVIGLVDWCVMVAIAYQAYGTSLGDLWDDIWVSANASVKFMTIDSGVLYLAVLLFLGYRCGESKAAKALFLTPVLGPATACCLVLIEEQNEATFEAPAASDTDKKEN